MQQPPAASSRCVHLASTWQPSPNTHCSVPALPTQQRNAPRVQQLPCYGLAWPGHVRPCQLRLPPLHPDLFAFIFLLTTTSQPPPHHRLQFDSKQPLRAATPASIFQVSKPQISICLCIRKRAIVGASISTLKRSKQRVEQVSSPSQCLDFYHANTHLPPDFFAQRYSHRESHPACFASETPFRWLIVFPSLKCRQPSSRYHTSGRQNLEQRVLAFRQD